MKKPAIHLLFLALIFSGACYRYVPADRAVVPRDAEVRVTLTQDGVEEMRGRFGPEVRAVEGPLVRWDDGGVGLLAEISVSRPGFPPTVRNDTILLLSSQVGLVELRQLDGKRTVGFAAGIVGAMAGALIAAQAFGGSSDDSGEGGGPDPEAAIIFRIPLSIGGG